MGRGKSKVSGGRNGSGGNTNNEPAILGKYSNQQLKAEYSKDIKIGDFINGKSADGKSEMLKGDWNKNFGKNDPRNSKGKVLTEIKVTKVKVGDKTTTITGEYELEGLTKNMYTGKGSKGTVTVKKTFKNTDILQKRRK